MSIIVGLHYGHHGSLCIVKDGELIAAVSSERLSRQKFSHGVTQELIDYVFDYVGITVNDVDYIGLSDWHQDFAFHPMKVWQGTDEIGCLWNRIYDNTCLELNIDFCGRRILGFYIGHQLCHAAAAYYTSPFPLSFCFTLDASGANNKNNSLVSFGIGNKLFALYCPGLMIGVAYGFFTEYLGLGGQMFKAGSTMALAGYGQILPDVKANIDEYVKNCFFRDDQDYHQWYLQLWKKLAGSENHFKPGDFDSIQLTRDIAATIQYIFEESILKCISDIDSQTITNLCLGGGSMLNCVTNSLILSESKFDNIHLFAGCGDDGSAIGSALYTAHHVLGEKRVKYTDAEICYLGPDRPFVEPDYFYLAQKLAEGKIIAWSSGRSEYGPRALGNRSLLADPRKYENREKINSAIKKREWFRPLAPIVMEEHTKDWFDFSTKSPFMLFTAKVKYPDVVSAINHIDNSARIQTVSEETNPNIYRLIKAFYDLTDIPLLLNTSLNGNGEPIVETDEHALNFFNNNKDVDILVLNGEITERS
jgi:carbamoyltransferase